MIYLFLFLVTQIIVGLEIYLHPRIEWNFKLSFFTATALFGLLFTIGQVLNF